MFPLVIALCFFSIWCSNGIIEGEHVAGKHFSEGVRGMTGD
jgi:hypothetical protein